MLEEPTVSLVRKTRSALRATAAVAGLVASAACALPAEPEPDLASVLERHADARGGREALESVRVLEVELEITEPDFTVTGSYVATREGWMRIDIFAEGRRVFTEALGPGGGWQMHADGKAIDLSPEGERALRRGISNNLYALHELGELGFELKLLGRSEREGRKVWEIEQRASDGSTKRVLLDAVTYLVASEIKTAALHPDIDPTETEEETFYSDHRATAGVLFSTRSRKFDRRTGELLQETVVLERRVNGPVERARFLRPPGAAP